MCRLVVFSICPHSSKPYMRRSSLSLSRSVYLVSCFSPRQASSPQLVYSSLPASLYVGASACDRLWHATHATHATQTLLLFQPHVHSSPHSLVKPHKLYTRHLDTDTIRKGVSHVQAYLGRTRNPKKWPQPLPHRVLEIFSRPCCQPSPLHPLPPSPPPRLYLSSRLYSVSASSYSPRQARSHGSSISPTTKTRRLDWPKSPVGTAWNRTLSRARSRSTGTTTAKRSINALTRKPYKPLLFSKILICAFDWSTA